MTLNDRKWRNLIDALENEKCILLLGPSISTQKDTDLPLTEQFARYIAGELELEKQTFDPDYKHEMTYMMQRFAALPDIHPIDPGLEAKRFYQQHENDFNALQTDLAALPFHITINTSPDDLMAKALRAEGQYETIFQYYNFRKEQAETSFKPSVETPLVFNLFGCYTEPESLVLTEMDQINFSQKLMTGDPSLPVDLTRHLDIYKTYLFLGFDWEQWYFRLLLHCLKLEKQSQMISPKFESYRIRDKTKEFYNSQFNFTFITEEVDEFVRLLRQKFDQRKQETKGGLKQVYIAYDQEDAAVGAELAKQLKIYPIETSHLLEMPAGQETDAWIRQQMAEAEVILLVISADFIGSEKIMERELSRAIALQEAGKANVAAIIARPCMWDQLEPLRQLPRILPRQDVEVIPLIKWEHIDDAYTQIVAELKEWLE